MKYIKKLRRILAVFLIVAVTFTSTGISSLAYESVTGATNSSQKGDSGVEKYDPDCTAHFSPAWLVYIQKVRPWDIVDGYNLTEVKRSAINAMLLNYPEDYQKGDNSFYTNKCAVIIDPIGTYQGSVNIYKPNGELSGANNNVYPISSRVSSNIKISLVSDNILYDDESVEKFRTGQMSIDDYWEAVYRVRGGGVGIEEAIANFVNQFSDIGSLQSKIVDITEGTVQAFPEWFDVIRNSQMLNLLAVINEMCDNAYHYEIENYLVTQNKNGSDEFYVPVIIAGVVANNGGETPPRFYSLPTYYHKTYSSTPEDLFNIPEREARDFGDYGANASAYEDKVHTYYEENKHALKSGHKFYHNHRGAWWAHNYGNTNLSGFMGQAYTCMPTDFQDKMTGNLGYTYFTFGGEGAVVTDNLGQFNITASSEQKNVTAPNTSVAALINVDLKCTDQQKQLIRDTFDQQKKEGCTKADIIVNYSCENLVGSGSSSTLIDTAFTEGATLSGGNKVTLPDMTFDTLEPYINGSKLIQVADSGILINGSTSNKYLATVTIKFPNKSFNMLAAGKTIETETKGSDTVSWGLNDQTNMDEHVHYYSAIGKDGIPDNYVEIKHNVPGHEEYEAMAGVPTNEDLYVIKGFRCIAFMIGILKYLSNTTEL